MLCLCPLFSTSVLAASASVFAFWLLPMVGPTPPRHYLSSWSWPVAMELLFTGRVVAAEETLIIGLLNKLVPSSELMKAAIEMGQAIAANDTMMVQGIKEILIRDIGLG